MEGIIYYYPHLIVRRLPSRGVTSLASGDSANIWESPDSNLELWDSKSVPVDYYTLLPPPRQAPTILTQGFEVRFALNVED